MKNTLLRSIAPIIALVLLVGGCASKPRLPAKRPTPPVVTAPIAAPAPAVLASNPNDPSPSLERVEIVDASRICYGDPKDFSKAAEINVAAAFGQVREWRSISDRHLTVNDPEYWLLIEKANVRFHRAIHAAATQEGVDLVADLGAIRRWHEDLPQPLPNLTSSVLEALRASEQLDDLHLTIASLR